MQGDFQRVGEKDVARYELVIFDFDGTLADSAAWMMRAVNPMARRYGFKTVTDEEIEMLRGRSTREVIRYLGVSPWKLPLIARAGKKMMAADAHKIPLFPETARMLRALHAAGVKIAVVSSNSEQVIRRVLGPELAELISLYSCGASLFGKARKFKQVTARGVSRDRVICIGDETRDIEAARAVGLDCGAVGWGYAKPSILAEHRPTVSFSSMSEIISYVAASGAWGGGD
ncbi:HAD family hydrolase [Caulobacter segnis]|uniref:HAD family hydrolase n=1 Tax=Caulobacter segnis TaxID=88688 RepID=A0A2W5VAA6_9CAUL|nr:HAD family hydrolase [Caulobacter segnis]PZR36182.1 MAG: HAD family hydrolase [Caulobacter segnis]